ncbi:response regulator transcription factor [Dyadobacter jiangsuensis]|uniref:AraC-like DNA-binding protein n=1 Tax=Dyadobacter jiangsuensis TaxID=1591085 RepID=A0A2P8GIJ8_9BACT|nr:DNA-binding response regulator [Dyadobacter jiangsuensis]PSL33795.1 AraC-like DNA-binding protein [Dyadobacter jiangsuensis]
MNSEDRRLVLIVDNSVNLYGLGREILKNNFRVIESNGGEEGLALARQIKPDLVICDISTSSSDGLFICENLKSDSATSHAPVILLGPMAQQIDGLRAGADDYISPPFDSHVLGLKIENLIRLGDAMRGKVVQEMSAQSEWNGLSDRFLEKLEQLVLENIADPDFGVHEMAFQIGISVSVLYRKLRLHTGATVNEFVKTIRMKRAMKLLETGIYPVNEVAAAIGYEDSKYFSKEFRKSFGKTPTEVKRRAR